MFSGIVNLKTVSLQYLNTWFTIIYTLDLEIFNLRLELKRIMIKLNSMQCFNGYVSMHVINNFFGFQNLEWLIFYISIMKVLTDNLSLHHEV